MKHFYIIALFLVGLVAHINAQGIPRFLWTPVVKPYDFVPKPSNDNQRSFNSTSNTSKPNTMGTPYLVTKIGTVTVNGKQVQTTDTFWVFPYSSNDRVGLSAKKSFVLESKLMNRYYTDPDTNKPVFIKDTPNLHSNMSGVRKYNPLEELLFARIYGNYFIKQSVNKINQDDTDLNVVDSAFGSPIDTSNLISTRNIHEVMKLGDYKQKVRMMNRLPHLHISYLYRDINGVLVQ